MSTNEVEMMKSIRLLLVEDNPADARVVERHLKDAGLAQVNCEVVQTAAQATERLQSVEYDLVLLDLGLPDLDGVEVCRRLRARSTVPIIAVTARGHQQARVLGLRSGADDYVVKPFAIDELTARMDAVLRRSAGHVVAPVIEAGPVRIDLSRRVVEVSGREVTLRRKESVF